MIGQNQETSGTLIKLITENDDDFYFSNLSDDSKYLELFGSIREQFPSNQNKLIVLIKLTGLSENDEPNLIFEDNDDLYEFVFVDEEIKSINEKQVKYLEFEVYFIEKKRLRVFFFVEKNLQNDIYSDCIKKYANRFIVKNKLEYVPDLEFTYTDVEQSVKKNENDVIVVITAGRFLIHVLEHIDATSVLIFTMPDNYSIFKMNYLNQSFPQVKEVHTRLENLLKDQFFLEG